MEPLQWNDRERRPLHSKWSRSRGSVLVCTESLLGLPLVTQRFQICWLQSMYHFVTILFVIHGLSSVWVEKNVLYLHWGNRAIKGKWAQLTKLSDNSVGQSEGCLDFQKQKCDGNSPNHITWTQSITTQAPLFRFFSDHSKKYSSSSFTQKRKYYSTGSDPMIFLILQLSPAL